MYKQITKCRICGSSDLRNIVKLGEHSLSGVFPSSIKQKLTSGPLDLVQCKGMCELVQLKQTYNLKELYGNNYGYMSSLNKSMVKHLEYVVEKIKGHVPLNEDSTVIDIGSNDGTLLKSFPKFVAKIGYDPVEKFKKFYPKEIEFVNDFFTVSKKKATLITAISMFYDLENPLEFLLNVHDSLEDDGFFVCEQSYLPTMLDNVAYDTICHEHLEYYHLKPIIWMFERVGFDLCCTELNDTNGGSVLIIAQKKKKVTVNLVATESLDFDGFRLKVENNKKDLLTLLIQLKNKKKKIFGYGASTKGNTLLQYCGITTDFVDYIADVNSDKFGCYTPGTNIPIISEEEAKKLKPDYFLVLPWHFKKNILERNKVRDFKFIFPLPDLTIE